MSGAPWMVPVKLFTSSGHFVADVEILPFKMAPDVLLWGSRVFMRKTDGEYREAFAYHVSPAPRVVADIEP